MHACYIETIYNKLQVKIICYYRFIGQIEQVPNSPIDSCSNYLVPNSPAFETRGELLGGQIDIFLQCICPKLCEVYEIK